MTLPDRDSALDALEVARAEWLAKARAEARAIAAEKGTVTVNDVRDRAPPLPEGVDGRVYGAVMRRPEWQMVGYVRSTRATSHNRPIARFMLAGEATEDPPP